MSELKACPFCNCMAYSIPRNIVVMNGEAKNIGWACGCNRCDLHVWGDTKESTEKIFNTRPIEDALRAELARLTAELALTEKKLCNIDRLARAEIARRDEIIARLKEDGERMADFFIEGERGNSEVFVCIYCDAPPKFQNRKLEHEEYCPVSKHDALVKELE